MQMPRWAASRRQVIRQMVVRYAAGRPQRMVGSICDITKRKQNDWP